MQTKHSLGTVINQMNAFNVKHGRFPEYQDFSKNNGLPTTRTLERNGGLLKLARKALGIQEDYRKGVIRRKTAIKALEREQKFNKQVYEKLKTYFPARDIHVESQIYDRGRNRTDFKVYTNDGCYYIDVFFAKDIRSWQGCIRHKRLKYRDGLTMLDGKLIEILLVCLNPEMTDTKEFPDKKIRAIPLSELWELCDNIKTVV